RVPCVRPRCHRRTHGTRETVGLPHRRVLHRAPGAPAPAAAASFRRRRRRAIAAGRAGEDAAIWRLKACALAGVSIGVHAHHRDRSAADRGAEKCNHGEWLLSKPKTARITKEKAEPGDFADAGDSRSAKWLP